jgi:hypothetical protein
MKKIFIIAIFSLMAGGMLVTTSCTKQIDEVYANPNADVRVPVEQLLPAIISCMAANSAGHGAYNDARFVGKYIQNWQFCNAGDMYDRMSGRLISLGSTAADMTASIYRAHYYDIGQNCKNMIQWAEEEKKWDYAGVGRAIFAWSWLQLTDVHGEVIFKQALDPSRITFNFDNQDEVYAYVKVLGLEAIDFLSRTGDGVSQANLALGDAYMYNGDVNKWKKFVYAILARCYNHVSNKSSYKPDSVLYYTDAARAMTTSADNAMVKFGYVNGGVSASANFMGPLRGNLTSVVDGTNSAIRQGAYIANLLSGANAAFPGVADPRAIYLLRKNVNGTFKGLSPNKGQTALAANDRPENFHGKPQNLIVDNVAPANDVNCRYIFTNTAPLPVVTAAEVQFIRAEALFRKGLKDQALEAYKAGIGLNFDMLMASYNVNIPVGEELTAAKKAAFLNPALNPLVIPALGSDLTMTKIMLQKYIALYGIGVIETWTDMRRFHYSDIDPATGQQVYRDFVVPSGTDLHPTNLTKTVQRLYPRYNSDYVWNIEELRRIGADKDDYHTKECWFSQP